MRSFFPSGDHKPNQPMTSYAAAAHRIPSARMSSELPSVRVYPSWRKKQGDAYVQDVSWQITSTPYLSNENTHHAAHFQEEHPRLKLFELSLEYLFKIIPSDTQTWQWKLLNMLISCCQARLPQVNSGKLTVCY